MYQKLNGDVDMVVVRDIGRMMIQKRMNIFFDFIRLYKIVLDQ